ncbi:hypothetical protein [Sphingobacterium sp.]|uniref:hypothetical protein n=1 Tax=Sphingobacterium sp. TaxID=341027 RepID=UPI00289F68E8|nr:hypothetical protein [Sphingobacterium sp.]
MNTLNNYIKVGITILLIGLLAACKRDADSTFNLSADVDVLSFKVGNIVGKVDQAKGSILVMVPEGTDLSAVAPTIELPSNAKVSPASGIAQNFSFSGTTPITYRVFNGNLFNTYQVTVKEIKAEITAFRIGEKAGIIDQKNKSIKIYLPPGTDLKNLSPAIEFTAGASITPNQSAPVDLSSPIKYSLAYMGQVFQYTVTALLGTEPKQILMIYNGESSVPHFDGLGVSTVDSPYPNPKTTGINATPFCASFVRDNKTGEGWHGGALWNANKVTINPAEYGRFSMMVLKDVAGDVQLEIQSDGEQNKDWLRANYSKDHVGEWQELVFQIPAGRKAIINNILVMPHEHPNGQPVAFPTQRMYWDELKALPKE